MNQYGASKTPFVFLIDYEMAKPLIFKLEEIGKEGILFKIKQQNELNHSKNNKQAFEKQAIDFEEYKKSFDIVRDNLLKGNSFLTNLTHPTRIFTDFTLDEIYNSSCAKYCLKYKDEFVFFSPETFVTIENGVIASFPMKGTIAANIADAENIILNDKKETAEHATIVDLIRNDLSMVADKVWVEKYRYLEKIKTNENDLWQVSSKICGLLPNNYEEKLGEIIFKLLPAGSISGAPKPQTLAIIQEAETTARGYYTGIFGYFDGEKLDSSVMIRFIEKTNDGLVFRSGGGITAFSDAKAEYQEMINKVYLSS
ncbi:MAG: aminodeoxychorismate synthase component I [Pseudarcicella sp.]|nr:aminodeoxychorismate synthase component I [Pseudarcicella sp.]